ncbi:hypothetical protein SH139x_002820 [Planctomycetaceae bacterium SH139]
MQTTERVLIGKQQSEIAEILANAVVRQLTTPRKTSEKDSKNVSHAGLISSRNDCSL